MLSYAIDWPPFAVGVAYLYRVPCQVCNATPTAPGKPRLEQRLRAPDVFGDEVDRVAVG